MRMDGKMLRRVRLYAAYLEIEDMEFLDEIGKQENTRCQSISPTRCISKWNSRNLPYFQFSVAAKRTKLTIECFSIFATLVMTILIVFL